MEKSAKDISLEWNKNGDLLVIFDPAALKRLGLKTGSEVDVELRDGKIYLTPIKDKSKKKIKNKVK
jgi:antitoxin component of MazEF toxin-antitoxin module